MHFVSATCGGETCRCGQPATHKVGEEIAFDEPVKQRHNLTAYVCCMCFTRAVARSNGPVRLMMDRGQCILGEDSSTRYGENLLT